MADLSDEELERVVHNLGHLDETHGNLPYIKLFSYGCCDFDGQFSVGYRDTREVFRELLEARRRPTLEVSA